MIQSRLLTMLIVMILCRQSVLYYMDMAYDNT